MSAEQQRCPVQFDHNSPEHARDWAESYRRLRESCPHAWSDSYGGYWVATRYKDLLKIAQRGEDFSTDKIIDPITGEAQGGASIPPLPRFRVGLNESEPPEWNRLRSFFNPYFTPQAVEVHREYAVNWSAALIDRFIEKGRVDLVDQFTNPLPSLITMRFVGFPLEEWRQFADFWHKIVYIPADHPEHGELMKALDELLTRRIDEEMELRRQQPRDDLFSLLATGKIDGQPFSRTQVQEIVFNFVGGGVGTTSALTTNALLYLGRNPEERRRLIEEPKLLPVAIEEFLRYFSVVQAPSRTVKRDVDVGGWQFKAGERVLVSFASANRDPEYFEDPDRVKLDRLPNRHVGFGAGMHRCLGSFLARIMIESMLREFLKRIPEYEVIEAEVIPYPSAGITNGFIRAPITFKPGARVGAQMPANRGGS